MIRYQFKKKEHQVKILITIHALEEYKKNFIHMKFKQLSKLMKLKGRIPNRN